MTVTAAEMLSAAELGARAEALLDLALRAGADEAEVCAGADKRTSLGFEKGEAKTAQVDRGAALGLRVFVDRRMGFVSTNQLDDAALAAAATDAVDLAKSSPRDEANVLPAPRALTREAPPVDDTLVAVGVDEVVRRANAFVASVRAIDPRLSVDQASLSVSAGRLLLRASNGLAVDQFDAAASGSVFGMAIDGDDVGGFEARGTVTRRLEQLDERVADEGRVFAANALGNLGAVAGETYTGPVLFTPEAFRSMFVGPFKGAANAIAVQRGRSRLAEKLGQAVAATNLTIHDDPTDLDLAGATVVDREGQPADRFTVLDRGVLQGWFHNGYSAAVGGVQSTGHAQGGPRSVPSLGFHALSVEGGDATPDELRRAFGQGLLLQRFSGSVDPTSGDFSGVAKSARWIEGGEIARSVREVLVAGNLFELLAGNLTLSRPEIVSGGAKVPWAIVDGVAVTAG